MVGVAGVNIHLQPAASIERHNKYERQHLQLAIDHSDIYFARPLNVLPLSQHLRKIAPINDTRMHLADGHTHAHTQANTRMSSRDFKYKLFTSWPGLLR